MSAQVNVPTNPKQRDADIENKLRLYGIIQAFANGKMPTNKQIDIALSSFTAHSKLTSPNSKLSDEGKHLLEDFRNVVEEAKRLLLVKNHDQAIQEFIWTVSKLGQKGGPQAGAPNKPLDKESAKGDGQQALDGLKVLGRLIITNGQFRKLLSDSAILLRDIAGDAAQKSASKVSPPEDRLRQIDEPAPDHQWHDAPTFNRNDLKQQAKSKFDRKAPVKTDDVRDVAGNTMERTHPDGSRNPKDFVGVADQERKGQQTGADLQGGLSHAVNELNERKDDGQAEDQKQRAKEYRERARGYLKGKMPQERREQTIWRLKKMVVEIQSHEDYNQAVDTLLRLAENYTGHAKNVAGQSAGTVREAHGDGHLKSAETQLKDLLERFANNTSADDLIEAINDVYRDADNDPELKNWFRSIDRFIRRSLKEDGYILQDDCKREYDQLYDHGNFLLRDRYREHTDRVLDEVKFLGEQFSQDADNTRFANALQKLFDDLGTDETGKAAFKGHLLKDITQIILPDIFESVRYVPVPRIEYSDPAFDAVVENLVLESNNLMPNVLEIGSDSYFRFGRQTISSKKTQQIMVSASQIQCDLRDVSYYVKRKQGFPSITDTGVADIMLGRDGFGFKLQLSTADKKDRANFFKVDKCQVTVKGLSIKLKQSKHKALFGIFKPLLLKVMKPVIVKVLEKEIRNAFEKFDALAHRIYTEEQKIESDIRANPDPENVTNIYQRYYQALQTELAHRKEKVAEKTKDKKVNVAVTQQDSMFQSVKLPGGISTKATEYKELAAKGEGWQSDVFTIGSAKPTSGIPKPHPISRRSPYANRRQLRDRDSGYHQEGPNTTTGQHQQQGFGDKLREHATGGSGMQLNSHAPQTQGTGYGY